VVNSGEERLFSWHLSFHFDFSVDVLQICVSGALTTKDKPAVRLVNIQHGNAG
jgi:hypothetical protein